MKQRLAFANQRSRNARAVGNRERARSSIVSLASAVLGNGAAVGVEDGGDHALVEPVRVGY
jgi:hypothetical protein